jgi:MinD superfamily P-loop ATPase
MKRIAVISGKGGTGKTVVSGALAHLITKPLVLADCDVDAANLELLLSPQRETTRPFSGMKKAEIDQEMCVRCGLCEQCCRFDAIRRVGDSFEVNPVKCEGCAVCRFVCPENAIRMISCKDGEIYYSRTAVGPLSHAELKPGSGTSGLLVSEVKKQVLKQDADYEVLLVDGPPGIGCPVIATMSGMDAVLIVTEPSLSALHDLERLVRVARGFDVQIFVVVNRFDLNQSITEQIKDYCRREGIEFLGTIPFDPIVIEAVRLGEPVTNFKSPAADSIRNIRDRLAEKTGIA